MSLTTKSFNTKINRMSQANEFPSESEMLSLLEKQYDNLEVGLVYGKAGLAIYYANLSNEDPAYKAIYDRLIEDVLSKVSDKTPIEFPRGLLGISFALDIILHFFKPGNPDSVLNDLDAVIYKSLDKGRNMQPLNIDMAVESLFYVALHLKLGIRNKVKHRIYESKAIHILNDICQSLPDNFFRETIPYNIFNRSFFLLYAIGSLYEQDIGQQRIEHICSDLSIPVASSMPQMQFNKLERLFSVSRLISLGCARDQHWKDCYGQLTNSLSLKKLFNEDFGGNQLGLSDGLTGAMLLMIMTNHVRQTPLFDIPWDYYKKRIAQCSILTATAGKETPLYRYGLNWLWGMKMALALETRKEPFRF